MGGGSRSEEKQRDREKREDEKTGLLGLEDGRK
jgi:hypothetical protein